MCTYIYICFAFVYIYIYIYANDMHGLIPLCTHRHRYIYIYVCVCVCVVSGGGGICGEIDTVTETQVQILDKIICNS